MKIKIKIKIHLDRKSNLESLKSSMADLETDHYFNKKASMGNLNSQIKDLKGKRKGCDCKITNISLKTERKIVIKIAIEIIAFNPEIVRVW